jgi:hypothetical protein
MVSVVLARGMRLLVLAAVSLFFISGCLSSDSSSDGQSLPDVIENKARLLMSDLTEHGFEVQRGYIKLYTIDDCQYSYQVMQSCYGNNPAAPYVLPVVPYWENEFKDPATYNAFGPTKDGHGMTFRLDRSEAILIFGLLPPPAAYFGFQTYLFSREGTYNTNSVPYRLLASNAPFRLPTFFGTIPNNPGRVQIFSSLSNNINHAVIERQSGAAFDQERYFIVTPDRNMDAAVRAALGRGSADDAHVFTEPLPSTVRTGIHEQADDFMILMRYAMPHDTGTPGTPSDAWRKSPPLVVLRIRDANQSRPPAPYPPVVLQTRTANREDWLRPGLNRLMAEIGAKWSQPCAAADCSDRSMTIQDLQAPPMNLVGPMCTEIGMNCLGDTQDTSYHLGPLLALDNDEVYAVVGTLGTRTGNASYTGVSINDSFFKKGIANIDDAQLQDTAREFAGKVRNADMFYVYYITRKCSGLEALTGGYCLSITESMIPPCPPDAAAACGYALVVQRNYIRPGTQRGPDSKLILEPRILKLRRTLDPAQAAGRHLESGL